MVWHDMPGHGQSKPIAANRLGMGKSIYDQQQSGGYNVQKFLDSLPGWNRFFLVVHELGQFSRNLSSKNSRNKNHTRPVV